MTETLEEKIAENIETFYHGILLLDTKNLSKQIIDLIISQGMMICSDCKGRGKISDIPSDICTTCHGKGEVPVELKILNEGEIWKGLGFLNYKRQKRNRYHTVELGDLKNLLNAQLAADQEVQAAINACHAEELAEKDKEIEKLKAEKKKMIEELVTFIQNSVTNQSQNPIIFPVTEFGYFWQQFKQEHGG